MPGEKLSFPGRNYLFRVSSILCSTHRLGPNPEGVRDGRDNDAGNIALAGPIRCQDGECIGQVTDRCHALHDKV